MAVAVESQAPRAPPAPDHRHVLVLEPGHANSRYWLDLWTYRELFATLAWRDVTVRYKQTAIGVAWAAIRPFLTMVVMTVVFHQLAKVQAPPGAPYAILVFAGLLPWTLFSTILTEASNSMVVNANLVGKVYFPRIIIPASTVLVALVDFLIAFAILAGMMVWYHFMPSWRLLLIPAFVGLAALASLGPALLVTALNVKYRDFRYVIPFIVQFGLYLAPVGYSSSVVPAAWRFWYSLNPVVGVIDGFRWCILGGASPLYWPGFVGSFGVVALFLVLGILYFRRTERTFADII
jgi:lipopolysaccharide transport system permease protein